MKLRSTHLLIIVFFVLENLFAAEWPSQQIIETLETRASTLELSNTPFADWKTLHSPLSALPVVAYGKPANLPHEAALNLITSSFKVPNNYILFHQNQARSLERFFYQEQRENLPVLCGRADFVYNRNKQLMRWGVKSFSGYPLADTHTLSMTFAAERVISTLNPADWKIDMEQSIAAWFPEIVTKTLRPVFWIHLYGSEPHQRWEAIIDASNGEIIINWPGIHTDTVSGTVQGQYWPEYDIDSIHVGLHPFESVSINSNLDTTNSQGFFSHETQATSSVVCNLRGPYVEVTNEDGPLSDLLTMLSAPYNPVTLTWTITDATRPELNLFYHTMLIHQWYKQLDPPFNALDYPLPAVANVGTSYDNAYWNGYGTYYGSGAQYHNFAMFSDVIYHEYTHGVTDGIYPPNTLPYIGQPGAMNEAWSDYFACTINQDPLMAEWIDGNPLSNFRNLNNHLVFPRNWVGEVHGDSPFISGSLWDIREVMGAEYTDPLGHFARYGLAETFFDYLVAVLETDDDDGDLSNGTPNSELIYESFFGHGIGPGSDPQFAISDILYFANGQEQSQGNGNRFIESGETAQLTFRLGNIAQLYPPPATDVLINVTTADPTITIVNGSQTIASLDPGSYYDVNPILLQVSQQTADHWAVFDIHVTSNGGTITFDTTFEFTVGLPHTLIVKDDPNTSVENFVSMTMREQDKIFDVYDAVGQESIPEDRYPARGLVVWLSGNSSGEILTEQDQSRLQQYTASGNKVLLSGQNIVDNLIDAPFLQNFCQVEITSDSTSSGAATASNYPFNAGEWFLLAGSDGAGNQYQKTSFAPIGSSQAFAYYGRNGSGGPVAAISFANQHGLLFGFGIEAISGMGNGDVDRNEFLSRLYDWASDVLDVEESNSYMVPRTFELNQAYPNPFNSSVTIEYSLPAQSNANLIVYDLLGRTSATFPVNSDKRQLTWSPNLSTGIYFAQLKWTQGESRPIKLMFLK